MNDEEKAANFFKEANRVWTSAVAIESVKQVINDLDARFGQKSPLNSMTKMYGITVRAKKPEMIEWTFHSLHSLIIRNKMRADDCSVRNLTGLGQSGKTEKCWTDVFMFKYEVKEYLLNIQLEKFGFNGDFKAASRAAFNDHSTYCAKVCPHPDSQSEADLSWQAGFKPSLLLMVSFLEEVIYDTVYDGTMKTALKARKVVEEWLKYQKPHEAFEAISDAWNSEKKAAEDKCKAPQAKDVDMQVVKPGDKVEEPGGEVPEIAEKESAAETKNRYWRALADRIVKSHIILLPELASETQLGNSIKASRVISTSLAPGVFAGVSWTPRALARPQRTRLHGLHPFRMIRSQSFFVELFEV